MTAAIIYIDSGNDRRKTIWDYRNYIFYSIDGSSGRACKGRCRKSST